MLSFVLSRDFEIFEIGASFIVHFKEMSFRRFAEKGLDENGKLGW